MHKQVLVVLVNLILLTGCSGTMPNLGLNNGKLMLCPQTPNCVNSQQLSETCYIKPMNYLGTRAEAHARLLQVLDAEKRMAVLISQEDYIRAEVASAVFRFVDDVEFYLSEEKPRKIVIHVRSASRIGHSDFGVNRKRIERIRHKFTQ